MPGTFDYGRARRSADRLIARFGGPGAILRASDAGSGEDMTNGRSAAAVAAADPSAYPCTLAVIDYDERDRDGTLIRQQDRRALIAAGGLAIEPTDADQLRDASGDVYAIVTIKPLAPAGMVVMYDVQVRR
ncbi:hypothetical protein [Methylobacterium sp. JK268]